jgi:hypothetical protein
MFFITQIDQAFLLILVISYSLTLCILPTPAWESGDYYQKQLFQNTLFPNGLAYDTKIEHYRTPIVNEVIACMAELSRDMRENKNRTSQNLIEKSGLVPRRRLELPHLAAYAPQAYLYTIPTPGH